jgi:hypothetical protein
VSWPVSDEFLAAFDSEGHEPLLQIEFRDRLGNVIASSTVASFYDLTVLDGSVNDVYRSKIRRQFDLQVVDVDGALIPNFVGDLLDPLSEIEVAVYRGLRLSSGDEMVPMGVFGLERNDIVDRKTGISMSLMGYDRSKGIASTPWRTPFTIPAGTNVGDAVFMILDDRMAAGSTGFFDDAGFEPTSEELGSDLTLGGESGSDPWQDALNLAEGIGFELFFNRVGTPMFQPVPDYLTQSPARQFLEGDTNLLLDPLTRSIDRTTLRNGAIVVAEASWLLFPLIGSAWDDNPYSALRRDRIGEFPEKVSSPTVFTQDQADAAALALFNKVHGVEEQVTWNSIPDPSLSGGDTIEIQAESLGGTASFLIESLSTPFAVDGVQSGTTRRRRGGEDDPDIMYPS